jgi:hypothetical protein
LFRNPWALFYIVAIFQFSPSATAFGMRWSEQISTPARWFLIIHATRITGARLLGVVQMCLQRPYAAPALRESCAQKSRSVSLIA